jgi:Mg-chelatase subunit ChlD
MPVGKGQLNKRLLVGIVLDSSSSMGSILKETISGTNEQFSALRDSQDAANTFVSLLAFNDVVRPITKTPKGKLKMVPCSKVKDISTGDYFPSGMTAMRDGVNTMIDFLADKAKKADDVLVVIISDGMENKSKTNAELLASKIKELQDDGWNFTYIGANQDLTQVAADLGIHKGNMLKFNADSTGTQVMSNSVAGAVQNYTLTRSANIAKDKWTRTTTQNLYEEPDDTSKGDETTN